MVRRWGIFGDFLRPAFPARRVQYISDLHSNSHYGHTMCRNMSDIQYVTAEIRRGKKKELECGPASWLLASYIVRDRPNSSSLQVSNQDSVMEFGFKPAILIMSSFATEAGPWALATPSVTDVRTPYRV